MCALELDSPASAVDPSRYRPLEMLSGLFEFRVKAKASILRKNTGALADNYGRFREIPFFGNAGSPLMGRFLCRRGPCRCGHLFSFLQAVDKVPASPPLPQADSLVAQGRGFAACTLLLRG